MSTELLADPGAATCCEFRDATEIITNGVPDIWTLGRWWQDQKFKVILGRPRGLH